jgi:hypothetical protein
MKKATMGMILALVQLVGTGASGQAKLAPATAEQISREYELRAARLEEIAMCHHAIRAARHDATAVDQNPYYRYIIYSPHRGSTAHVYPIPERCRNLETNWVLGYTNMGAEMKTIEEKSIHDEVGMTVSDIASDAQFLTVVIDKVAIEGDDAVYWENMDKHVPKP